MPESYRREHGDPGAAYHIPTLSQYDDGSNMLININCIRCKIRHHYRPQDLLEVCGDVALDKVTRQFRCERCGRKDYLEVSLDSLMTSEMTKLKVRRLVKIKTIRRPVWEDVTPSVDDT
ncbi:hypothetical protein N2599_31890 (plasmid) [Rhizobium sullae]|uniref:Uncharacterized protein n=1 Tax=Rhizobium sullae TaxID=50338 RepID=A0ABY5XSC7_RHISU|nr:hypothetical protein [Rhizobium sullae]UWU17353.1 hypothetical protein N2599_31890 [Rhizobium sullae]